MSNEITNVTYVDGVDVKDMNDGAIFNRIGGLKKELKELGEMGITGAAFTATKNGLITKVEQLLAIVDARHEEAGE